MQDDGQSSDRHDSTRVPDPASEGAKDTGFDFSKFRYTGSVSGSVRRSPRCVASPPSSLTPSMKKRHEPGSDDAQSGQDDVERRARKRRKEPKKDTSRTGYAPPELYAHLPPLRDVITPNLICLFIGLNPGIRTSTSGHAYSHPSNLFWKLLYRSKCTTRQCRPDEDGQLPALFALGNTNIVSRPSRNGAELSRAEMDAGVTILEEKIRRFRPEAVAIVGKSVWESIWRVRHGRGITKAEFAYGWQDVHGESRSGAGDVDSGCWAGARVFVATSTSGLAASLLPAEKEAIWNELGSWVAQRRAERGEMGVVATGTEQ